MANMPKAKRLPWQPVRKPQSGRTVDNSAFYESRAWRKLARAHKMYYPNCQRCLDKGIVTPVTQTHHVKSVRDYPELALEWDNLESICDTCHNIENGQERHRRAKAKAGVGRKAN